LAKHFTEVAEKEKAKIEPEAIRLIAHAADGSVRDGLSLLDQAIARGNGKVAAEDVKDMLGLADRGQSMALCRQLLRGEMKDALQTFATMQQAGSDPLQVLQDMCEFVHLLTRGQVISGFSAEPSLPEYDRQLLTELSDIKIPALARAWQILLKGISEVQGALHPAQAAEMVLIRMAYASELPPPADLIKQLRAEAGSTNLGTQGSTGSAGAPPPSRGRLGGGAISQSPSSQTAAAISIAPPIPQTEGSPVALAPHPVPQNYKELVALFAANREGALHAQLYGNVQPVRCEPGVLEIRPGPNAPSNLASNLAKFLTAWTGQRWMVSVSAKEGQPTLAEQDRVAEKERKERALSHPLVQAVVKAFPDAKLTSLRQKAVAPPPAPVVESDITDEIVPIEGED
jgi:DNA polymerase-3 subunit gamma/tau